MKIIAKTLLALSFASAFAATTTLAQYSMVFDENGNGTFAIATNPVPLHGSLALDPVSGRTTLCYDLTAYEQQFQFTFYPGDLLLSEPGGGGPSDLIRFEQNNPGHPGAFICFYSDLEPGESNPDMADVGVPQVFGTNWFAAETGPEGNNRCFYQPTFTTQPGFVSQGAIYTIISDVPEPGPLALLGMSAGCLLTLLARRRTASHLTFGTGSSPRTAKTCPDRRSHAPRSHALTLSLLSCAF